ncbi:C1 family peptidase [bacterium]|nr:C1 family peptidase [bacterium]
MITRAKSFVALIAFTLLLPGCALTPGMGLSKDGADALAANGAQSEARTIKTEIGPITLGLLPNKHKASDLASFESEMGIQFLQIQGQTLPAKVDLRSYFTPVRNQGALGSCAAFATTSAMEATIAIKGRKAPKASTLSPLFFYYATRKEMQDTGRMAKATKRDTGSFMDVAARVAVKVGAAAEATTPYVDGKAGLAYDASQAEYDEAKAYKQIKMSRVSSVKGMKSALASNHPIIFGVPLYDSFMTKAMAQTGEMPLPGRSESVIGGHAMTMVGYDDAKQAFLVRNSWGKDWGQQGYFYMPYDFFKPAYIGTSSYFECYVFE